MTPFAGDLAFGGVYGRVGPRSAVNGAGRLIEVAPFPPELIVMRLFEVTPLPLFERSVIALGVWAKWLAFAGTTLASLAGAGVAGLIVPRIAFGESPFLRALCHGAVLTLLGLFFFSRRRYRLSGSSAPAEALCSRACGDGGGSGRVRARLRGAAGDGMVCAAGKKVKPGKLHSPGSLREAHRPISLPKPRRRAKNTTSGRDTKAPSPPRP